MDINKLKEVFEECNRTFKGVGFVYFDDPEKFKLSEEERKIIVEEIKEYLRTGDNDE